MKVATSARPLIGVTTSEVRHAETVQPTPEGEPPCHEMALGLTYLKAIEAAGGIPVVIPPLDLGLIEPLLDRLAGICLSGGPDLHPKAYGAEPDPHLGPTEPDLDRFELAIASAADIRGIPVLAICRGTQALNIVRGGTLVQHLPDKRPATKHDGVEHRQRNPGNEASHSIRVDPASRLAAMIGTGEGGTGVNSFHHQAIDRVGGGLVATAWAQDGTIEAVEDPSRTFLIGVQWHAELLVDRPQEQGLFRGFVEAARCFGGARGGKGRVVNAEQQASPTWADWAGSHDLGPYTLGVEEEAMLLDPRTWALAHRIDDLLPRLSVDVQDHVTAETHGSAFEVQTGVTGTVSEAIDELLVLRAEIESTLASLDLRAAVSGTHPFAIWQEIAVSGGERYQLVYGSMRELARREPTFALHVHVGLPDPETAIRVNDRMRVHLPLLLALSANSPFWQGRDSGLASARTPLFQAFPRVGVPRAFGSYEAYVETVDLLIRTEAVPECTFLWWDVRPQPALGTIEVRVMDAQTRCRDTTGLVALVQCLVKMEAEQGYASEIAITSQEVIAENRFLAARDGIDASLIDPELERRVPVPELVADLLAICRPHAQDLGCEAELASVTDLVDDPPARRQIETAKHVPSLGRLVERLSDRFAERLGV